MNPDIDTTEADELRIIAAESAAKAIMVDGGAMEKHCLEYELERYISMYSLAAIFREVGKVDMDVFSTIRLIAACKVLHDQFVERIAKDLIEY